MRAFPGAWSGLAVALLLWCAHSPAQAVLQPVSGLLTVTVRDEGGRPIAGARVGIVSQAGDEAVAVTRPDGTIRGEAQVWGVV